ncbi:hypothetical protein BaRGS_00035533 [Batillaria attramentaria]|uniref:Uncharacterized protein n=1 Tax=Batillaria attramentaria TaxID=370345 RepID=A0ABD0JEC9_9CAEN
MRRLLKEADLEGQLTVADRKFDFDIAPKKGDKARIRETEDDQAKPSCWFHENTRIQAKAFFGSESSSRANALNGNQVLDRWWKDLKLGSYITAFTKEDWGSVFLGLKEEKEEVLKWKEAANTAGFGAVFGTERKVWEDDEREGVYHVAEESNVKRTGDATGHFEYEGVPLTPQDLDEIETGLRGKIRQMRWHPSLQDEQVKLVSHLISDNVDGNQRTAQAHTSSEKNLYILEARVKRFKGVCFQDINGPEAYTFVSNNPEFGKERRIPWEQWLTTMNSEIEP